MVGYGRTVVVTSPRHCKSSLQSPDNPSLLLYDANGQVVWRDGSTTFPICLPNLQNLQEGDTLTWVVGMNQNGCLVKVPITEEDIVTCEGPTITVPALDVT